MPKLKSPTTATIEEPADKINTFYLAPTRLDLVRIALLGAIAGLLIPLLDYLIGRFFIEPIFCQSADAFSTCAAGGANSYYAATVIVSVIAIVAMVSWQVFRPLPIAVAAGLALWGFKKYAQDVLGNSATEYYVLSALAFCLTYLLFYWLLRLRNFTLSIIAVVITTIGLHLILIT